MLFIDIKDVINYEFYECIELLEYSQNTKQKVKLICKLSEILQNF